MHLLYIDESGTSNLLRGEDKDKDGNSRFFVLGAILIKATDLEDFESNIQLVKNIYLKKPEQELKSTLRNKHIVAGKTHDEFYDEIYTTLSNTSAHCFGTQVNKEVVQQIGVVKSKIDIYTLAFQHLLRSVNRFINQNKINESVTVFIDGIDKNHNRILFEAYKKALASDHEAFIGFDERKFSPSINFVDSEFTIGMQLADLVAGALWRGTEKNKKKYSRLLKKRFPKDVNGQMMQYSFCLCINWI